MANSTNINSLAESVIISVLISLVWTVELCLFSFINTRCSMLTHSRLRLPADSSPQVKRADDNTLRTCDLLLSYVWSIRRFSLVLPGTSYSGSNLCNTGLPKQRLGYIRRCRVKTGAGRKQQKDSLQLVTCCLCAMRH